LPDCHTAIALPLLVGKEVLVDFAGGDLSSDAGLLPLALVDQKLRLTERLAQAIEERRDPCRVRHSLLELIRERVYLIAQGYEDAIDANTLRHDPLLKLSLGREPDEEPLAGQSTLSRLENSVGRADLHRLGEVLLELFVERCGENPRQVVLDLDPFCDPCHGSQQLQLFNGHYDCHCYLPLYLCGAVDGGRQYVIGVLLRSGNATPALGACALLKKVVLALRARFPDLQIIVRGDGGFGVPTLIGCCRKLGVEFCLGKPQNPRLHALSERVQMRAALGFSVTKRAWREYGEFSYAARGWKQEERVVVKAEVTQGKLNPRFVVTNLAQGGEEEEQGAGWSPEAVYSFYCQRGEPENRIKEFKVDLAGDRLSCHSFLANQFRLIVHVAAYALYQALQDLLAKSELAQAQVGTLRVKVMKVAARVLYRCRCLRVQLPSSYPWQGLWRELLRSLLAAAP
jgi:hypothetical protein